MFCLGSLGMSGSVTFSYVLLRYVKAVMVSFGCACFVELSWVKAVMVSFG